LHQILYVDENYFMKVFIFSTVYGLFTLIYSRVVITTLIKNNNFAPRKNSRGWESDSTYHNYATVFSCTPFIASVFFFFTSFTTENCFPFMTLFIFRNRKKSHGARLGAPVIRFRRGKVQTVFQDFQNCPISWFWDQKIRYSSVFLSILLLDKWSAENLRVLLVYRYFHLFDVLIFEQKVVIFSNDKLLVNSHIIYSVFLIRFLQH